MAVTIDGTTGITTPTLDAAAVNATDVNATNEVSAPKVTAGNIVGEVAFFGMTTPPAGWLKANGAAISRTTYAALFAAIGTTYGAGDGSTTFLLPDLRGEFPRGWDEGRGVDSGRAFGSAQLDAVQSHTHAISGLKPPGGDNSVVDVGSGATSRNSGTGAMNTGRSASETRPRNIALLACIKF